MFHPRRTLRALLPPLVAIAVPLLVLIAVAGSVIYWHELKRRPA